MNIIFFERMHGGATHFPIGLIAASFLFDLLAFVVKGDEARKELRGAAYYTLLLGALGSIGAVLTGLIITRWDTWGEGMLLYHHYFVWPAFALLMGIAAWRITVRDKASRAGFGAYLTVCAITTVCMMAAGYWGGELLLNSGS